ncbi:hypothetical protein ACJMK2_017599 [Sinanodonta woodiana]|uniref:Phospholipase A2 n=1 Tax=Sinanodonta woodiana TaxID=1069815 RepID=A0ABD3UE16_SINWO
MNECDPYQKFEVEQRECMIFTVKVLCGRKITSGWNDYLDTPDPYIALTIQTAPDSQKKTKTIDNEVNPIWNETFTFLLDENNENIMEVTLMEANYTWDQTLGTTNININQLEKGTWIKKTLIFNNVSEVDLEMKVVLENNPKLRYTNALCEEEKAFLCRRREKVFEAMREILGEQGPTCLEEVPTVSVIGSGGGFRAMVGLHGVTKALVDSGILQCTTYLGGLSGSSWYISTLYSHPDWPNMHPRDMQDELKKNISSTPLWQRTPQTIYRYLDRILLKRRSGQPVSLADFWGYMIGDMLLNGRLESKLSDQREKVVNADVPLPLLTCVHVKNDRSARSFQEWVEFSPFEIGVPKYGIFMKTELFGSEFFMGNLCRQYEEPPIHFLLGIWGSAFSILFKRLALNSRRSDPVEKIREEIYKQLEEEQWSDDCDVVDSEVGHPPPPMDESEAASGITNVNVSNNADGKDLYDCVDGAADVTTRRNPQSKGYWHTFMKGLFTNKTFEFLRTRSGRAGVILNFMRGLTLRHNYSVSPLPYDIPEDNIDSCFSDDFSAVFEIHPTTFKHMYLVDAGLAYNSPYPLVLRPQRHVDIILSFDFSGRPSDSTPPFKELLLAEKWAKIHKVPFPPIDIKVFDMKGMNELYIFKHPTDPHCPVVLHFPLVNIEFRKFTRPGVPRETKEEQAFADFDIFDDPITPYSTFNFQYSSYEFDRLAQLTEFNTLLNVAEIKKIFEESIKKKRSPAPKVSVTMQDVPKDSGKRREKHEKVH